jgi:hypothetical protein
MREFMVCDAIAFDDKLMEHYFVASLKNIQKIADANGGDFLQIALINLQKQICVIHVRERVVCGNHSGNCVNEDSLKLVKLRVNVYVNCSWEG